MSTKILKSQNTIRFAQLDEISESIPLGTYAVNQNSMSGEFFLTVREELKLPSKIYGRNDDFINRVLKSYKAAGRGIGVLLSGLKGAGKSVESTQLCIKSNQPILLISSPFVGDDFNNFLASLPTACTIFIDEFEKVYASEEQKNYFLPVLDGAVKLDHLFVLTSNSSDIGEFFTSRPGRVRYHKEYTSLSDEIIEEIVKDKLENKDNLEKVMEVLNKYHGLSIDSLTAILNECNIHNETPDQFAEIFNVRSNRPKSWDGVLETYIATLKPNLTPEQMKRLHDEGVEPYEADYNDFYERKKVTVETSYAEILRFDKGRPFVSCYFYNKNDNQSLSISWSVNAIAKVTETRNLLTIENKNGEVIYARPSQESKLRIL